MSGKSTPVTPENAVARFKRYLLLKKEGLKAEFHAIEIEREATIRVANFMADERVKKAQVIERKLNNKAMAFRNFLEVHGLTIDQVVITQEELLAILGTHVAT